MNIDHLFSVFKTAAQGLSIQRENIAIASENIANANTTSTANGGPYKPKTMVLTQASPDDFQSVLSGSGLKLRTTSANQYSSPDILADNKTPEDLGPKAKVIEQNKFRYEYDPNNPDADENGMVKYPAIDMVKEMTRMVGANRLYEANLSVIEAEKEIVKQSLQI